MKSQLTLYLSALLLSSCSSNHDTAHPIEQHDQNPQLLMGKAAADSILATLDPDDYLLLTYKFR